MNPHDVHLFDLPNEILFTILQKLNNLDVLYSLFDINDGRLDSLVQDKIFSTILNFGYIDNDSPIDRLKLDRLCVDILPIIGDNVKRFILKPVLMERILLATDYSNLTNLKILHFNREILYYLTDESPLRYVFQEQISDLILVNDDTWDMIKSLHDYTLNVYTHILNFFNRLKHLTVMGTFNLSYPCLVLQRLSSTTFSSSTLTHLCIDVYGLDDCLCLLDGRLTQLNTLLIRIDCIIDSLSTNHNMDNLPNLKIFSLKSYTTFSSYDKTILPLLRRMSYLENLTLYLRIENDDRFIDGTHLQDEILVHMPQLNSFVFYISTYVSTVDLVHHLSSEDIQRTFTNMKQQNVTSVVHYTDPREMICSIFSIPFVFDRLEDIGNNFPNIIFSYVTYLRVEDIIPFNHEFFIRVARAFPSLRKLRIANVKSQSSSNFKNDPSFEIALYPHLIYLDLSCANYNYIEQFLNENKTYAPSLTKLRVVYTSLRHVTNDFTKDETRRNCAKVARLLINTPVACTMDFYRYFPLLL